MVFLRDFLLLFQPISSPRCRRLISSNTSVRNAVHQHHYVLIKFLYQSLMELSQLVRETAVQQLSSISGSFEDLNFVNLIHCTSYILWNIQMNSRGFVSDGEATVRDRVRRPLWLAILHCVKLTNLLNLPRQMLTRPCAMPCTWAIWGTTFNCETSFVNRCLDPQPR